ncbi:phosphoglycerate mutase-like protein 4 isoform X1 [Gossypium australe]|uniref:Phosphoglycerate mutase-like protein 4 isoform X1 n=1 Tax=Gossypium australe TaxID=47621 RepID=A0A5B6UYA3_9ROSI|nr:phosphoglycerate mutase-like protein 4 isoform X1 [Gossypium australe]
MMVEGRTVACDISLDQPYTEIIVVRHGETAWNATGRIQGHMDVELNEVGRQQAASLAERLSRVPEISAIYSSDLKRALETAETIVATCGKFELFDTGLDKGRMHRRGKWLLRRPVHPFGKESRKLWIMAVYRV